MSGVFIKRHNRQSRETKYASQTEPFGEDKNDNVVKSISIIAEQIQEREKSEASHTAFEKKSGSHEDSIFLDFTTCRLSPPSWDPLYKISLEDQYKKLPTRREEKEPFVDFFRRLYCSEDRIPLYVSWPSFEREPYYDKHQNTFYRNFAIRTCIDDNFDVVLMTDVRIIKGKVDRYELTVKGITVMDSNVIRKGEKYTECHVYLSFSKKEIYKEWEDCKTTYDMIPDEKWAKSVFNADFIYDFSQEYVVEKPEDVISDIERWEKYIQSRKYLLELRGKHSYAICEPEFIEAYATDKRKIHNITSEPSPSDSIKFIESKQQVWTLSPLPNFSERRLIVHIQHDVLEKEFKEDEKNYKRNLDRFTHDPIKVVDPSMIKEDENKHDLDIIFELGDTRISIPYREIIEPTDKLAEIDSIWKKIIVDAEKENKKRFDAAVKSEVEKFTSGEMVKKMDTWKNEHYESIRCRVVAQRDNAVEKELGKLTAEIGIEQDRLSRKIELARKKIKPKDKKMTDKELIAQDPKLKSEMLVLEQRRKGCTSEEIGKKYPLDDALCKALMEQSETEAERLRSEKRAEVSESMMVRYQEEFASIKESISIDIEEQKEEAKKEYNIVRFHICFEVEVEETSNFEQIMQICREKVKKYNQFSMKYNDIGDWVLLERQKKALDKFKKGYVMNPFLATALYSPGDNGSRKNAKIEMFYQENLNESQKNAVEAALSSNGLFLIQGPPGTGKTQVIAEITTQFVSQGKKVLIASENNKAVDNAFGRLPKNPMIRPLRLVSDKRKDNTYSVEQLLSNFYANISKSLDEKVSTFNNYEKYRDNIEGIIKDLKMKHEKLCKLEKETEKLTSRVLEKKDELENINLEISEAKSKNKENEDELDELKDKKRSVEKFESIENLGKILEKHGVRMVSGSESLTAKTIVGLSDSNMIQQLAEMEVHSEYFDLMEEKESASIKRKAEINKKISEYEKEKSLDRSSFTIYEMFGRSADLAKIQKVKGDLGDTRRDNVRLIEKQIELRDGNSTDTKNLEHRRKMLERDIVDLEEEGAYIQLENERNRLHTDIQKIFYDLKIIDKYKNIGEAIVVVNNHWEMVNRDFKNSEKINKARAPIYAEIAKYLRDESVLKKDRDNYTKALTDYVNVVGMTCTSKDSLKGYENIDVNKMGIDVVIIDEVSKVPFVELIQPILYGKTVILVGDHRQLSPIYSSEMDRDPDWNKYDSELISEELDNKYKEMYEESLFKKLFETTPESYKTALTIQYRMHPQIMDVVNTFYADNPLKYGGGPNSKDHQLEVDGARRRKIITPNKHILFIDCKGYEKQESGSTSFSNETEALVVKKMLELIDQNCKLDRNQQPIKAVKHRDDDTRLSVGVICPYSDQAKLIRSKIKSNRFETFNSSDDEKLMVKAIDDFQGDERDIIILSTVRTTDRKSFLHDYRRVNVAISRARRLLIIVGNETALSKIPVKIDYKKFSNAEKVYEKIIQTAKNYHGYCTAEDIMGGDYVQ